MGPQTCSHKQHLTDQTSALGEQTGWSQVHNSQRLGTLSGKLASAQLYTWKVPNSVLPDAIRLLLQLKPPDKVLC